MLRHARPMDDRCEIEQTKRTTGKRSMKSETRTNGDLGAAMRRWREKQGLAIEELAQRSRLMPSYLETVEAGARDPSFSTVCAIAEGLGLSVGKMFTDEAEDYSESTLELVRLCANVPEPVRGTLPRFFRACIEGAEVQRATRGKQAKGKKGKGPSRGTR